jgi:vacuolar-type H+-ATPase subunit E/Vma4
VGYRELLQALEEEVGRQIEERGAQAAEEQRLILETTRAELLARREDVLEKERRRLAEESARALSTARLEQARTLLAEMRQELAELLRAAETRLAAMNDRGLLARLVDEVVPELGEEGSLVFRVKQGYERHLESHLRQDHPALLARATIEGSPDVRGGVEVSLGRQRLDNTLPSRLQNAWRQLEPELAAMLFRESTAEPSVAASDEPVPAAIVVGDADGAL